MKELALRIKNNHTNFIEVYLKGKKLKKSFAEFYLDVVRVANKLKDYGIHENDTVGIYAKNCYEWLTVDVACFLSNITLAAFQESFSEEMITKYVGEFKVKKIYSDKKFLTPELERISSMIDEIEEYPKSEDDLAWPALKDDRKFTIVFSSGTTGIPKAIGLRQASIEKTIMTAMKYLDFKTDDKNLCFLPLSVFTSRMYIYSAFTIGFHVTVTNAELMFSALRLYQPTIMQGVPYFFENVYFGFQSNLQDSFKKKFFYRLYRFLKVIHLGLFEKKLKAKVYKEIRTIFGKRMRCMITGTAPIQEATLRFYKDAEMDLFESYGLNETGVLTVNYPGNTKIGSVGKVLPYYEVITDEQEQIIVKSDYFWSDGYLDKESSGKFKINQNGYYETGDTGHVDADGFLFITGRCVDTITLKNGKKVNPQKIEAVLNKNKYIRQSMVFSKDLKQLNAVIVKASEEIAEEKIKEQIEEINQSLGNHEQIVQVCFSVKEFNQKNAYLTANLKLNRKAIYSAFADKIEV